MNKKKRNVHFFFFHFYKTFPASPLVLSPFPSTPLPSFTRSLFHINFLPCDPQTLSSYSTCLFFTFLNAQTNVNGCVQRRRLSYIFSPVYMAFNEAQHLRALIERLVIPRILQRVFSCGRSKITFKKRSRIM